MMNTIDQAVQHLENNQSEQALKLLAIHLQQATIDEQAEIAEIYKQWGFLDEASGLLTKLVAEFPNEIELKAMLAEVYIELGEDGFALELLSEIEIDEAHPLYLQILLQQADLYQAQGLFEVAEQKLQLAKQVNQNEPIIDFALGELLFSLGDYKRATTYYQLVLNTMTEVAGISINERLAEANAALGEYEQAFEYYEHIETENVDLLFKKGLTAFYAKRPDVAIHTWEAVIKADPAYHSVYYQLAVAYEAEERLEEAYNIALKGLKHDDFNKELYYKAGVLAHQLSKNEESETYIREAIALEPDFKEAILFLIKLLRDKEDFQAIIELIHSIKELSAEDANYDWELARAYKAEDSYDKALKYYQDAYNDLNQDGVFMKEYGYYLLEEGQVENAVKILSSYLKLEPLDIEVEEYVDRLLQIEDN